jgi:hypothetical protein
MRRERGQSCVTHQLGSVSSSNVITRGYINSGFSSMQQFSHDASHPTEPNYESTDSPSAILKRRITAYRSSTERLATYPSTTLSGSVNGLNEFYPVHGLADRETTYDSLDKHELPSNEIQHVRDVKTSAVTTAADDRRSVSSEKVRRQFLGSKIFKPFQQMRRRKKSDAS